MKTDDVFKIKIKMTEGNLFYLKPVCLKLAKLDEKSSSIHFNNTLQLNFDCSELLFFDFSFLMEKIYFLLIHIFLPLFLFLLRIYFLVNF